MCALIFQLGVDHFQNKLRIEKGNAGGESVGGRLAGDLRSAVRYAGDKNKYLSEK